MENKQLSLEDKIKPYLILAKACQYRLFQNKDERIENLLNAILRQMLIQVSYKDVIKEEDYTFPEVLGLEKPDFELLDKQIMESTKLPMSNLIDIIKLDSLQDIKNVLEKAEKENIK